jgi:ribosomal protein L15E
MRVVVRVIEGLTRPSNEKARQLGFTAANGVFCCEIRSRRETPSMQRIKSFMAFGPHTNLAHRGCRAIGLSLARNEG